MTVTGLTSEVAQAPTTSEFDLGPGLRMEAKIDALEADAITERWEFGHWMLSHVPEGGKKLPDGFVGALAAATGKTERELRYRRQFAERFPTREALGTAVPSYKSWTEIRDSLAQQNQKDSEADLEAATKGRPGFLRLSPRGTSRGAWIKQAAPLPLAKIPAALALHERHQEMSDAIRTDKGLAPLPESGYVVELRRRLSEAQDEARNGSPRIIADLKRIRDGFSGEDRAALDAAIAVLETALGEAA